MGTQGDAVTTGATVSGGQAQAYLTLNPAETYQIVVTPSAPFPLPTVNLSSTKRADRPVYAQSKPSVPKQGADAPTGKPASRDLSLAKQWIKAFGITAEIRKDAAEAKTNSESGELARLR